MASEQKSDRRARHRIKADSTPEPAPVTKRQKAGEHIPAVTKRPAKKAAAKKAAGDAGK